MRTMLEEEIRRFVTQYPERHGTKTTWRTPVVGFASAADPLFAQLKQIVGPTHALPGDLVPGAKTVVAYFVPFAESIVKSNIAHEESSREWADAYVDTNQMLSDLNGHLASLLEAAGHRASNLPPTYNYDEENLRSDWSHRSAAVIAGVGTFGVHHMLITEAGCCGRIGSVVTDVAIDPTPRPKEELCLFYRRGVCGACVKRCVADALSIGGGTSYYDKWACNEQIYGKMAVIRSFPGNDSCGKCMVGVPCATKAPRMASENGPSTA